MAENNVPETGLRGGLRRSPRLAAMRMAMRAKAKHRHLVLSASSPMLCLPPGQNPSKSSIIGRPARAVSTSIMTDFASLQQTSSKSRQKRKRTSPEPSPEESPDGDFDTSIHAPKKKGFTMLPRRLTKKRRQSTISATEGTEGFVRFGSFNRKKRKRKRERDLDDNISCQSLMLEPSSNYDEGDGDNLSIASFTMGTSTRRLRSLVKHSSIANLVSPTVSTARKVGHVLQRSMSFKTPHSPNLNIKPSINIKPYCKPSATPTKRRDSVLWSETVKGNINEALTKMQIKRQEAIFELFRGEMDLQDDLRMIMKTYRDSMRSLGMLNESELETIFGPLEDLQPLHKDLIERLKKQKRNDGTTDAVGKVLSDWLPTMTPTYTAYCCNQLSAKVLLDEKRQDKKVGDFLERCQESPFSRKLDLWSFLDVPRSRLVKYPLLLKNILRLTPNDHEDRNNIIEALKIAEENISEVDRKTGEMKCRHYINLFEYLDERQRHPLICTQKAMLCGGILRNNKGTKLHVFLFEDILVVTRTATRNNRKCYQLYRQPIVVENMEVVDIPDGEVKLGGSFRGAFTYGQTAKHAFRVKCTDPLQEQNYTFFPNDEHDKKQWLQLFRSAISMATMKESRV